MANFRPITRDSHVGKSWLRATNFAFASSESFVPVVGVELAKAVSDLPLAFILEGRRYRLVALLSVTPGKNMFVGADGKWLGGYVPALFLGYPFRLLRHEGSEASILCVDEESKLVIDARESGEEFTDADGNLSPALKGVLNFLGKLEASLTATDIAVAALASAGVIGKWELKIKSPQGERLVDGLFQVNETALAALEDETFLGLRKAGALALAYCQLISMRQIQVFERLAAYHAQFGQAAPKIPDTLDELFHMADGNLIRFS